MTATTKEKLYVSIRSPHRSEGRSARGRPLSMQLCEGVSIRSPHRSEGRFLRYVFPLRAAAVSIRSPHRSEGRSPARRAPWRLPGSFNPLPSPKRGEIRTGRRAQRSAHRVGVSIRSPHRSEGRSGSATGRVLEVVTVVSIRSPHRSEGRCSPWNSLASSMASFQSAPLTEARGDGDQGGKGYHAVSFNPLPSPKRGEMCSPCPSGPGEGRVSIRSPHRSEGRSDSTFASPTRFAKFQSAPLTEARGDSGRPAARAGRPCFNPLPSPKRGEICPAAPPTPRSRWFQSAPLTEARGDARGGVEGGKPRSPVSIRSPHRSEGRSRISKRMPAAASVSIRSPHRSEGRYGVVFPSRRNGHKFQSAPLTEARGDPRYPWLVVWAW